MPRTNTPQPKERKLCVIDDKLCMNTCPNCPKRNVTVAHFCPYPGNGDITQVSDFIEACENGDIDTIERLRRSTCKDCRETNKKAQESIIGNGTIAKKNRMIMKIKQEMEDHGCDICGCFDIERLELDHPDRKAKIKKVLDARGWPGANGPQDMWNEYQKCQVLCNSCHLLQPSHNGARGANSAEMPKGENSHSKEYHAKYARENKEKMQAYNRKRKREMKECQMCHSEVLEGTEIAFHWAHRDERTKIASVSKLCENTYNEKNIKKIDDEIEKCDLLCSGCHKQFQTQEHFKDYLPIWEELIERGVPKPKDWDSWQQKEFN